MMKVLIACGLFLGLLLPVNGFAQADRSGEVQNLIAGLESASQVQRVNAAKVISRSGLQDHAMYRMIADLLKAGYSAKYEKKHADEMSWLCKALAASGDQQYRELLDEIAAKAPSIKLKKYAKQSAGLIDHYAKQNQILNSTETFDDELSAEDNRLVSMFNSDDVGLKRDAAKIALRNFANDEKVYAAAASALSRMAKDFHFNSQYVDTMAWLCKALAASGDNKYIETLEQVHDATQSVKLRSYASKALAALK